MLLAGVLALAAADRPRGAHHPPPPPRA
jgi:hypothetical protein